MLRRARRFVAAYLALALSMCGVVAVLVPIFGAYRPDQLMFGFITMFLFSLMIIPLHLIVPFLCVWLVIHAFRYFDLWHFLLFGGLCGFFVFMTLPDGEDPLWSFRWRGLGPLKAGEWKGLVGLVMSGCVGGWAARSVGRTTLVERYRA
ncbi:MAG: hypothetical protein JWR80_850 [Bradyrhizobium sp.]|nr:hypothetical protein [Bradyrhizobium sp.]